MFTAAAEEVMFFEKSAGALALYEAFAGKVMETFPNTAKKVQKTQVTFSNRHVYACVSLLRVLKKAQLPEPYIVVTLGLSYPLASPRVAARVEPYPGRWTTHIVVGSAEEVDDELLGWVREAYEFAESKGERY